MEKNKHKETPKDKSPYKIIALDNEKRTVDSLSTFLGNSGYSFIGVTDPMEAIEKIKKEHFDLMLLDSITPQVNGGQVLDEIRKYNKDLYVLMLAENKEIMPPVEMLRKNEIQGLYEKNEKNDKYDQLLYMIESGIKSIEKNKEIKQKDKQIEQAYMESIETLRYTVEVKDKYTKGHSDRVSAYAVLIGEKLGLSETELKTLKVGGLFHDIGKIGIPDNILLKNGKLTDEEYEQIKNHPSIGAHILSRSKIFEEIIPIVLYHHERYDGGGYPEGLKGEEIPYLARIITVADSFDAMTTKRPYRNSLSIEKVKKELKNNAGTQFDPELIKTFIEIIENNYNEIENIQKREG